MANKYSKWLSNIETSSLKETAFAIASQWQVLEKLSGKRPKACLLEIGIKVPQEICDNWETINFQKLYEGEQNDT